MKNISDGEYEEYLQHLSGKQNKKMRYEKELATAQRNKVKSEFLSNMSHDLRTPMNAIVGYTNLALKDAEDIEKTREYLKKIKSSSEHLLSLINDILEMSYIEAGRLELLYAACNLRELMQELQGIVASQVDEKNQTLSFEEDITEEDVYCDKLRLNQVLLNILSNAIKYTPERGQIYVLLRQKLSEKDNVGTYEFQIEDNGIGMAPEFVERIFDAFERERNSTDSGIPGLGLGMTISKKIVDLMGGTIDVKSEQGAGSVVTVRLKLRLQERIEKKYIPDEKVEKPDVETKDSIDFSGKRVLLVDDIDINREIAKMILEMHHLTVEQAINGEEAVEKIKKAPAGFYQAVLMDIMMPVMNGYEAANAIRSLNDKKQASIPIIAMTANTSDEDRQRVFGSGMNDHIAKPIDEAQLIKSLRYAFEGAFER